MDTHTPTDLLCICFVTCAKLIALPRVRLQTLVAGGWCGPPPVGFNKCASMLISRVTASIAWIWRGGTGPCWIQMNSSDPSQISCPSPRIAGMGGKMEHREESPFCVDICAGDFPKCCSICSLLWAPPACTPVCWAQLPRRQPGGWGSFWKGPGKVGLAGLEIENWLWVLQQNLGQGQDTCFCLILLPSDVLGCYCNICILGYCG